MKVYQWLDKKLETVLFEMGMEKFIILEVFLFTFIAAFLELFPINSIGMCVFAVVIGVTMNITFLINFFNIFMIEGRVKGRRKLEWH